MSENQPEPVPQAQPVQPQTPETTLTEEFREFGHQLGALLRALRSSPRAKEIETQVNQAMHEMEQQVNEAMSTARQRLQEQNLQDTLKGAVQTAADEGMRGLAHGLRLLNEQMAHMAQDVEKGPKVGPRSGRIEIDGPEPAKTVPPAAGENGGDVAKSDPSR